MQAICKKYTYNHVHDATLQQDIMKELAGADGVRKLKDAPAPGTGTAHSVANSVSYLSAMMDADTDMDYSESAYAATSDSELYKETRKPRGCKDWIQVKHKNSPKTKLTSPVNSITTHNAYDILSHSDGPIPDDETIYIDPPLAQQDADIHEHCRQRKIARCQHIKQMLHLLSKSKNLFLDNNITQAEDEWTILAKCDQTNTQRRAIDSAHIKNNKPAIGLAQRGCNTTCSLGTTIGQTLKKISNNKHVRFAKNNEVHLFDNAETPIMITYDSGANGHYISEKDRHKAGLPII
jgi:hypothetical protein